MERRKEVLEIKHVDGQAVTKYFHFPHFLWEGTIMKAYLQSWQGLLKQDRDNDLALFVPAVGIVFNSSSELIALHGFSVLSENK
jgi:hypothetical protein